MKAVVAAFNQEKALVGAFSVITNLRMELFQALPQTAPGILHRLAATSLDGRGKNLIHDIRLDGSQSRTKWQVFMQFYRAAQPAGIMNIQHTITNTTDIW